ncbi:hypothetical protein C8R45DRAFT_132736 [Mycena sanguinolenta]|nr:hypothetical protein C8R45DRAFT_132736 [Mycena sanguinolenta]
MVYIMKHRPHRKSSRLMITAGCFFCEVSASLTGGISPWRLPKRITILNVQFGTAVCIRLFDRFPFGLYPYAGGFVPFGFCLKPKDSSIVFPLDFILTPADLLPLDFV